MRAGVKTGVVALAAVVLILTACAFGRQASAASTDNKSGSVASPDQAPAGVVDARDGSSHCPLRFPSPLPVRQRVVPILMYHRIDYVTASTPAPTLARRA